MAYDKRFDDLSLLATELQKEAIREAEAMLEAQLAAASAADQRAMAWAGFLVTIAVAAAGGAFALLLSNGHHALALIGMFFAINVVVASISAMDAARPTGFCFPGSFPADWLPSEWIVFPQNVEESVAQARREQASSLQNRLKDNAQWAKQAGHKLALSMDILLFAVVFWSIIAGLVWLFVDH